jgi:hydroxypyruvate isomerase
VPRFAANLRFLFNEVPFRDRFRAAAEAGFQAVEFPYPYEHPAGRLSEALEANRLAQVLINAPPGNLEGGERGLGCLPERRGEFQDALGRALEYARALRCPNVNVMAGNAPADADRDLLRRTYVENLRFAAAELGRHGIRALIEPLNPRDAPGYFLTRLQTAMEILAEADAPNLYLQYDLYHAQITQGDLAPSIERYLPRIAHLQIADTPGRHEPGTGEIHFPFLFSFIDAIGYGGWIGCEYEPLADTVSGLAWARSYLQPRP